VGIGVLVKPGVGVGAWVVAGAGIFTWVVVTVGEDPIAPEGVGVGVISGGQVEVSFAEEAQAVKKKGTRNKASFFMGILAKGLIYAPIVLLWLFLTIL
jgi:hypothetical protein